MAETILYYFFSGEVGFLFLDKKLGADWYVDVVTSFTLFIGLLVIILVGGVSRNIVRLTLFYYLLRVPLFACFYFETKAIPLLAFYLAFCFFVLVPFKGKPIWLR